MLEKILRQAYHLASFDSKANGAARAVASAPISSLFPQYKWKLQRFAEGAETGNYPEMREALKDVRSGVSSFETISQYGWDALARWSEGMRTAKAFME
jgi:hypothetical protein